MMVLDPKWEVSHMTTYVNDAEVPALLTVGEVAAMLNCHPNTVRRWAQQGLLKTWRIGRRQDRRFPKGDVMEFLHLDPAASSQG